MAWSRYQEDIFDAVESTNDNLLVNACPGSGKTTTIREIWNRLPEDESVIYLAFNKAIVEEARGRCLRGVME